MPHTLINNFRDIPELQMSKFAEIYERIRPLIVLLGLAELVWIAYWMFQAESAVPGYLLSVVVWIVAMLAWMAAVIFAGTRDFFLKHTNLLLNLAGVVLVLAFSAVLFGSIEAARNGLVDAASNTTDLQLVSIHVLRLLAIGTVIKYMQGQLPLHFVVLGSLPDFAFALSAVALSVVLVDGAFGQEFLMVWHLVGFSLFLGAGISMFFSVPSPLRIYYDKPDASIVFQYPMVLAPNFTVPLFMLAHAFALAKLFMI